MIVVRRWFESLKLILSGTTRPTRRGRVFKNLRPRKPQLSRHYRNVSMSLTLHNLQVLFCSIITYLDLLGALVLQAGYAHFNPLLSMFKLLKS